MEKTGRVRERSCKNMPLHALKSYNHVVRYVNNVKKIRVKELVFKYTLTCSKSKTVTVRSEGYACEGL